MSNQKKATIVLQNKRDTPPKKSIAVVPSYQVDVIYTDTYPIAYLVYRSETGNITTRTYNPTDTVSIRYFNPIVGEFTAVVTTCDTAVITMSENLDYGRNISHQSMHKENHKLYI